MQGRKPKKYWFWAVGLLNFICLCFISGTAFSEEHQQFNPVVQISKSLSFKLSGEEGYIREIEPVKIKLIVGEGRYQLQFNAGLLHYKGGEVKGDYVLEASYWINDPKNTFTFGNPLVLHIANPKLGIHHARTYEMLLYGGVTIHNISDQPAGDYEGEISVTVAECM